jgi:hypothetical protein
MNALKVSALVAMLLAGLAPAAAAAPFDGATPMQCEITAVMACTSGESCVRGTAATVALPPVLLIDVAARRVSGDRSGRTVRITSVGHGGGRLMLHGQEVEIGGRAWNVVVLEATGTMTGAVLSEPGGYLLFGTCTQRP